MAKKSELDARTQKLIAESFEDFKSGMNVEEVAMKYGVTSRTVYNHLQTIADNNSVDRQFLLERKSPGSRESSPLGSRESVEADELIRNLYDVKASIERSITKLNNFIKTIEINEEVTVL